MTGKTNPGLKPNVFFSENRNIQYEYNFPIKWETKLMQFSFRNLTNFPPNSLNEDRSIVQSKNCQELPWKHGNWLI